MKKLLSLIIVFTTILSVLCFNASAVNTATSETIYLDDGSYIIVSVVEIADICRAANTKSGQKNYTYYDSDNTMLWKATLSASFTYTGDSAACTSSSITHTVYDSAWKITEATATKSGNKATGDVTAKRYVLGIAFKTIEQTITLTCSASGVLS